MKVCYTSIRLNNGSNSNFKGWAKVSMDGVLLITGIRFYETMKDGEVIRYFRFPEYKTNPNNTGGVRVGIPIVNIKDETLRKEILDAIFAEYDKLASNK